MTNTKYQLYSRWFDPIEAWSHNVPQRMWARSLLHNRCGSFRKYIRPPGNIRSTTKEKYRNMNIHKLGKAIKIVLDLILEWLLYLIWKLMIWSHFFLLAVGNIYQWRAEYVICLIYNCVDGDTLENNRRDNQTWTTQRNWQHMVHKTKTNKRNIKHNMCGRIQYRRYTNIWITQQ